MDIYHDNFTEKRISSFACQNGFLKVVVLKGNGTDCNQRLPYILQTLIWRRVTRLNALMSVTFDFMCFLPLLVRVMRLHVIGAFSHKMKPE